MTAMALPKASAEEKAIRAKAVSAATKYAIEVPFKVMQTAYKSMDIIKAMTISGNPNSVSDAGVGALCARTAVMGAYMNVKINAAGFDDQVFTAEMLGKADDIVVKARALEDEVIALVNNSISGNA